jgi:hypothetical protein
VLTTVAAAATLVLVVATAVERVAVVVTVRERACVVYTGCTGRRPIAVWVISERYSPWEVH